MKQKDKVMHNQKNRQLFKLGASLNACHINTGNSFNHEMTKAVVCYERMSEGHEVLTEAECKNGGGRPDVVDLDAGEIIEVVESESDVSIANKEKKYPLPIITRFVYKFKIVEKPC